MGHAGPLVADAKPVGGAHHHIGFVNAAGHGPVPAALIQHKADSRAPGLARQSRHDLLGSGHLRHATGIDETHRLDAPRAGAFKATDELDPVRRLEDGLFVLEAVSRPNLNDFYLAAHGLDSGAGPGSRQEDLQYIVLTVGIVESRPLARASGRHTLSLEGGLEGAGLALLDNGRTAFADSARGVGMHRLVQCRFRAGTPDLAPHSRPR